MADVPAALAAVSALPDDATAGVTPGHDNDHDRVAAALKAVAAAWPDLLAGLNGLTGVWTGTQAQYDALTPTQGVLYVIVDPQGVYTYTFEQPDGALPSGWSATVATGGAADVVGGRMRLLSGQSGDQAADGTRVRWVESGDVHNALELLLQYRITITGSSWFLFMASDAARSTDYLQLNITPSNIRVGKKINAGAFVTLATITRTSVVDTDYWIRWSIAADGTHSMRQWADGATEPTTWDYGPVVEADYAQLEPGQVWATITGGSSAGQPREVRLGAVTVTLL